MSYFNRYVLIRKVEIRVCVRSETIGIENMRITFEFLTKKEFKDGFILEKLNVWGVWDVTAENLKTARGC